MPGSALGGCYSGRHAEEMRQEAFRRVAIIVGRKSERYVAGRHVLDAADFPDTLYRRGVQKYFPHTNNLSENNFIDICQGYPFPRTTGVGGYMRGVEFGWKKSLKSFWDRF
jgi:hypothetical protein